MKFHYRFSNLLGTVYRRGNLIFAPDGATILSPVGNKLSVYDLKSHTSLTLPVESRSDFTTLALSPNGILLLAANAEGEIHLIRKRRERRFQDAVAPGCWETCPSSPPPKLR